MLYKLPNGNWIDPALVTSVKGLAPVAMSSGENCDERVGIYFPDGDRQIVTPENCYAWADDFAAVCNQARAKAQEQAR